MPAITRRDVLKAAPLAAVPRLSGCSAGVAPTATMGNPIELRAADGVMVTGAYSKAGDPKAFILLFHQAGSGRGEYDTIVPRLLQAGYSTLAIDQRAGGDMFGTNTTASRFATPASYSQAKLDLEAAVEFARAEKWPIILWGSSYSAALVFEVAAEHPSGITAILAFSPGEYLGTGDSVRRAASKVRVPVFITSANEAEELEAARAIFEAVEGPTKNQFVPKIAGVHGSSTLIASRNPQGAEENWTAVLAFLSGLIPTQSR